MNLNPKIFSESALGDKLTAKTNISSFGDPRGIYGSTADVSFGSPISMDQIVFAEMREPVAKRVVVDVAEFLRAIPFKKPRVAIVGNCEGQPIFTPEAARAEAIMLPWSPVRWDKVMRHLVGRQVWTFAEIGHGSVLTNMLRQEHGQLGLALLTMENII